MPVSLRNVSGVALDLDGKTVENGDVIEVKGGLRKNGPDDGALIGSGDDARVYPSALWSVESGDDEDDEEPAPAVKKTTKKDAASA